MSTRFTVLWIAALLMLQACSPATEMAASSSDPLNPPATETALPDQLQPIVETTQPGNAQIVPGAQTAAPLPDLPTATPPSSNSDPISEIGITLQDNGRTFVMHVGDSFLLNLGMDVYEWSVSVDNENVLRMKMGVMVIKGAQGIYNALAPGTATLTATGNPLCLQSKPPCAAPSILFTVTLVVN